MSYTRREIVKGLGAALAYSLVPTMTLTNVGLRNKAIDQDRSDWRRRAHRDVLSSRCTQSASAFPIR
jgi:hypothetical protein